MNHGTTMSSRKLKDESIDDKLSFNKTRMDSDLIFDKKN